MYSVGMECHSFWTFCPAGNVLEHAAACCVYTYVLLLPMPLDLCCWLLTLNREQPLRQGNLES